MGFRTAMQELCIFRGTWRQNLDPMREFEEAQCNERLCQMTGRMRRILCWAMSLNKFKFTVEGSDAVCYHMGFCPGLLGRRTCVECCG